MASPWKVRATGDTPGGMVADAGELRRGLALLADPDGFCQVVALPTARCSTLAGSDLDGLCIAVESMPDGGGVYLEINPVKAGLASKAKAADVVRRRWLFLDIDPIKEPGHEKDSATDDEKERALAAAQAVFDHLCLAGWPAPLVVDSGNGWYLLYRIDTPNDDESRKLVRQVLYHLSEVVKDHDCSFDRSVHNADRLAKLPGTWAKKGPNLPDRPHRVCRLVSAPSDLVVVSVELMRDLLPKNDPELDRSKWRLRTAGPNDRGYALAALQSERVRLALTPPGGRDTQLYKSGAAMGEFVGAGCLTESEVSESLADAARQNGLLKEIGGGQVLDKLRRSIAKGKESPRKIPERPGKSAAVARQVAPPDGESLTVKLSTVKPAKVEWLIKDRVPRGFITIFAGRTSVGKSFVAYDLLSRMSSGGEIPCSGGECFLPGGSLIIGEDSPEYVIVPRLIEAGAALERIHCMTWKALNAFSLSDTDMLDRAVNEIEGGVSCVLIDPPTNFLKDADEHKNSEVRQIVMRVVEWAFAKDLAVIFVLHTNKSVGKGIDALNRVMGSVAWVTTARIAHAFSPDPNDPEQCLWLPIKSNLGKLPKAVAYKIAPTKDGQAVLEWVGEVDTTADEAMNAPPPKQRRDVKAADWLIQRFRERLEWESDELFKAARQEGISRDAIFEAKSALKLPKARKHTQENGDAVWMWWVPADWPPLTEPSQPSPDTATVATVATLGTQDDVPE